MEEIVTYRLRYVGMGYCVQCTLRSAIGTRG